MKICENCGNEHKGNYGSGRFCSNKCARGFSTKNKRSLINDKVSKKLSKEDNISKICPNCQDIFTTKNKIKKFCSKSCSISFTNREKWKNKKYRTNMVNFAIERHKNNDENFGWQSRNKLTLSYPEILARDKLKELKIYFIRELRINKYFIDFALPDLKIAIEIDGQQHKLKERKKSDIKKDAFLNSRGWKVIRIKFPEENIKESINKIFEDIKIKMEDRN